VCVCVCVCARARVREKGREKACVCVCMLALVLVLVCVCVRSWVGGWVKLCSGTRYECSHHWVCQARRKRGWAPLTYIHTMPGICALATEEHPLQKSDDADLLLAPCILIVLIQRTHRASIRKLAYMELSTHCSALQW